MTYYVVVRGPLGVGKSTVSSRLAEIIGADHILIDRILEEHGLEESLLASVLGFAASFAALINTISFSTTVSTSIEQYNINQPGGSGADQTLTATLYEQTVGTQMQLPSGNYYPQLPLVYVVVT